MEKGLINMQELTFITAEEDTGERLDKFLSGQFSDMTRSFLQKLIKEEQVFVDVQPAKANYRLKPGQTITVHIPPVRECEIIPEHIPLDILYEDSELLVVNKPKGMVVHPSAGHSGGTLVNAVLYYCKDSLSGINGTIRPGIVHRIDKDTTGSLIICKNDESHLHIAEQIKEHSIKRIYRGIVSGNPRETEGTIEGNISRHPTDRKKMAVTANGGKPPLLTIKFWSSGRVRHTWNFAWKPDGRTRSAYIWRASGIPCWAIPYMETPRILLNCRGRRCMQ